MRNYVSIDTDDVFYMEYGPYHTYTFRIKNDNAVSDAPVENLILSLEPDGSYKEMINTYSVTREERQRIRNGENFDFTGRISTRDIEKGTYAGSVLAKTVPGECVMTYELVQEKCGHGYYHTDPDTPECDAELKAKNYYIMHVVCDAGDTPGGATNFPDGNGSGTSAPGGSSGTGQNNPIEGAQDELGGTITLPNFGFPNPRNTPCEKTKALLQRPNVQQAIAEVTDQAINAANNANVGETGRLEKNDGTVVSGDISGDHFVIFGNSAEARGVYHNHTMKGAKIQSPPDIDFVSGLARFQPDTAGYSDPYVGMIGAVKCASGSATCYRIFHYVIRFNGTPDDLTKNYTDAEMKKLRNDYKKREKDLSEKLPFTDFLGDATLNKTGLEKLFFDTLDNMNLTGKVILQRVDDDGSIKTITLDQNGIPEAIPCP